VLKAMMLSGESRVKSHDAAHRNTENLIPLYTDLLEYWYIDLLKYWNIGILVY